VAGSEKHFVTLCVFWGQATILSWEEKIHSHRAQKGIAYIKEKKHGGGKKSTAVFLKKGRVA